LGSLSIDKTYDGNFTGKFHSRIQAVVLRSELEEAKRNGFYYRVRVGDESQHVQGFSEPAIILAANMDHQFRLLFNTDRQTIQSLAVFPGNVINHEENILQTKDIVKGSITVNTIRELPLPDTMSYIQKMEKERQARQHGAQNDNRSFIQKYWMYIAAAVVLMVISNAAAAEQAGD
uniref:ER membrane protein complex subunit 10 n=1 Tax=Dracunculus medinensis TaxID=318479 RepID=A0A0N4ULP8_DRAME